MFENRTDTERTIIYVVIALLVTLLIAAIHYLLQGWAVLVVGIVGIIEFFCIFYILYLPLKIKKQRERK